MKVCRVCGDQVATKDGDNHCRDCEQALESHTRRINRRVARRREREQVLRDLGLVKVKGALGGTYWE